MIVTQFPSTVSGPAERLAGFVAHLRANGFSLGPKEVASAMQALTTVRATDVWQVRLALRTVLVSDTEAWRKFDDLFDAYWFNAGKQAVRNVQTDHVKVQHKRPMLWQNHFDGDQPDGSSESANDNQMQADPDGDGEAEGTEGRLVATKQDNLTKRDLRELMNEEDLRRAEEAARRLGNALRDRRSRRRKQSQRGAMMDLRKTIRGALSTGGDPMRLFRKHRPDRPLRVVALCDVSGSMTSYSRVFLAFLKGLIGTDSQSGLQTEAYLFHTRLMRVTDALRDNDSLRAATRLSLMAEGFGGGTDIAGCLQDFVTKHSGRALNGRTVVVILSDGYCTAAPAEVGGALGKLRRKCRRIVWLNPLKGWKDYAPIAGAIAAAEPYLDAHLPANTIEALLALEPEFAKL